MKIKSIQAYKRNLALQKPYTTAWETVSNVESVFFEVVLENGIRGIGAANPAPEVVGETTAQSYQNLQSATIEFLIGKDINDFQEHIAVARKYFSNRPGTQACIDIALHDAFCQYRHIAVADFYGRHHTKMLTSVTIGIEDVNQTIATASACKAQGFRILKLKTGLDPDMDAERIIKVKEKFGNHFIIRVDANTGYTLSQLQLFLAATNGVDIELIEQPLAPAFDKDLLHLSPKTRTILAADESLKDAGSAIALAQRQLYGIFNIKLMKCGGIQAAIEIAAVAKPAGIELFWGCNDESRVSIAAALHAAFACAHTKYLDLDGSFDLAEDVASGGFFLKDGYLCTNGRPGLGLSVL